MYVNHCFSNIKLIDSKEKEIFVEQTIYNNNEKTNII
jgi:hypothetical protein